ncbi:tetratricopeptide repeat protein [Streptomyces murinus]|uniref:tetratricopeptide repeat protein n=1 Tax=Streptomyces murinus TaxID=33900 RepID=UPI000A1E82FA|nr:tetratricopeptide repeat protein [Streptomyces murinus]WDO05967.1 tetratricopeptide repeat protein [Streptomyces murinus]
MSGNNDARADGQGRVYQASGDQHITEHHHHSPDWSGPDSVRRPAVGRAPAVLRDRVVEMERLRAAVEPGVGNRVYVLHGLGGCGKTAVAYTLFQHATAQARRVGLWVNASDPASLRAGMLAVAADRGATDGELVGARSGLRPAADLVWHYLDRSDQPWLLVLDNADDPSILRDGGWLRTSPLGTVIVTTRQAASHWWPGAELLQFGVLPRTEAALVLRDLAPEAGTLEDAADVADSLGRLPLALTLAGGFLAHQVITTWTLADYHRKLETAPGFDAVEFIDQGAVSVGNDSRRLIGRTWQLSLDSLSAQGLPEATHLLRLLACWSSAPLPVSVLSGAEIGTDLPSSRVESALRGLIDHSLTELIAGEVRCVRTHGVLLESVARATPSSQRESIAESGIRLLTALLPENPERGVQDSRMALLTPHVLGLLRRILEWETSQRLLDAAIGCVLRLVVLLHRLGDYTSALSLADEVVSLTRDHLDPNDPSILRLRLRMGRSVYRLGRFEEAETLHRQVLSSCERTLGPDALDTLEGCLALARPVWQLGRQSEALSLVKRSVVGRTKVLGSSHPLTLIARAAVLELVSGGDLDEWISEGNALVVQCNRLLGERHSITLASELNLADLLRRAGKPDEALALAQRSVAAHEQCYGADYPIALAARTLLGMLYADTGRYAEAIEQAELVLAGRTRVLGAAHPWTLSTQDRLRQYRLAGGCS